VPPRDSETATFEPSDDGTKKSIVTLPVESMVFGSTSTRSRERSSTEPSATSSGWFRGGRSSSANSVRPRYSSARSSGETPRAVSSVTRLRIAGRAVMPSRKARVKSFCALTHDWVAGSDQSSIHW